VVVVVHVLLAIESVVELFVTCFAFEHDGGWLGDNREEI
jgi:hypothetical protein